MTQGPMMEKPPKRELFASPARARGVLVTVLLYASFATLWILFSDRLLGALVTDHETLIAISILKGFFYVALTSLALYWLLRREPDAADSRLSDATGRTNGLVAWPRWRLYAIAIALCLAALLVRQGTAVVFASSRLLTMMMLPITVSAALGGFGPGLVATLLLGAAAAWLIPPADGFAITPAHDIVLWAMLIADGLLISLVSEIMHRALRRETDRSRQLLAAQDSLRESEARYRSLFEAANVGKSLTLPTGEISVNRAFCDLLGYSAEELRNKTWQDLTPPEDVAAITDLLAHLLRGERDTTRFEKRYLHKSGAEVWADVNIALLRDREEKPLYFVTTIVDITERKRAEEALAQSENKFRSLFENHAAVKFIIDPENGNIVDANAAAASFYGWQVAELCRMKIAQISTLPPAKIMQEMEKALRLQNTCFEFTHRKADGSIADVEMFTSKVRINGKEYLHSIIHDITEKRHLEHQLLQAQKMESVGRLAGGVAHDFNNMLTVILGNAEMAAARVQPTDPIHNDLRDILSAARRSADITRQLLAFARKQTISPRVVDLNETVEGMLKMLRRLIGEDIDLAWLPGSGLWPVLVDPSQIDQILANLCVNARDAIGGVGKVTIRTENAAFDEAYWADHPECLAGEFVLLAVRDDGCGMDRITLEHLFEPFFTTKEVGQGTGLGLATVYGIVQQNRGFINVDSEPAKGTTFRIYLPRHAGGAGRVEAHSVTAMAGGHGETVLVVEDDLSILDLARRVLAEQGYVVLDAPTPARALELAEQHRGRIDLLLTDVVMPEQNGRDLAGRLQASHPELKVLFMSGYTADVIAHHRVLEPGVHFIQKPFGVRDLADRVRDALCQE